MSPNAIKMAPIQLQDVMVPKDVAPKATRKKSQRNQGTPPPRPRAPAHKGQRNSPVPAILKSKRSVSFSLPVLRQESLSDSELTKVQEDSYAGAKFSEAPSPDFLPMPPSTWLVRKTGLKSSVRKEYRSSAKPPMNVPCDRITDELKILLKVAS